MNGKWEICYERDTKDLKNVIYGQEVKANIETLFQTPLWKTLPSSRLTSRVNGLMVTEDSLETVSVS